MTRRTILCVLLALALRGEVCAAPTPAAATTDESILAYLTQAIAWYRQQIAQVDLANEPSDVLFAAAVRQKARELLQLAFAFARAEVSLKPEEAPQAAEKAPSGTAGHFDPAALARMETSTAALLASAQAEVESLGRRVADATGRRRALLESQLAEAKSEQQLAQARHDTIASFAAFMSQAGGEAGGQGLMARIEELERSDPEATGGESTSTAAPAQAAATSLARQGTPNGLLALTSDLFALSRSRARLRDAVNRTAALGVLVEKMRGPLRDDLRTTLQRGQVLSGEAQSADLAVLAERKQDLDQVTAHFKLAAAAMVPLGKQAVLLGSYSALLGDWHAALDSQYDRDLRVLLLHLGLLALGVGVVLAASELWRRATLRYVHDARRRQQSLLVRRILAVVTVCFMVAFSFVTELGSLATFAGFITAGLAVALQNVILSVVAYFFLIGKYGVRVGDRVQISGIDGNVIDVGLVRLHLMELRADGHPTGRVVAFSNAVLFQSSSNFFKQLPGSNFTWHQVALTFSSGTDYRSAERRLLEAVEGVYSKYRENIARQHEDLSRNLSIPVEAPRPESQFRLSEGGLEMTIRYPVPLDSAAAIDDQVTRALLDAVEATQRLALVGSATPTLRAVPETTAH